MKIDQVIFLRCSFLQAVIHCGSLIYPCDDDCTGLQILLRMREGDKTKHLCSHPGEQGQVDVHYHIQFHQEVPPTPANSEENHYVY